MGRIRTVKPEFFKHGDLFDLEQETGWPMRIAYEALWCQADREGRFKWRPRELKLDCLPYDNVDFSRVLDALATRGFVVRYASGTEFYGHIPTFKAHQFINNKEPESVLPAPPEAAQNEHLDASSMREARDEDASGTRGVKERNGKEGNTTPRVDDASGDIGPFDIPKTSTIYISDGEDIYQAYPKHVGREAAIKAIKLSLQKLQKRNLGPDWLMARTKAYTQSRKGQDAQFTPNPATWYNQGRYDDDTLNSVSNGPRFIPNIDPTKGGSAK